MKTRILVLVLVAFGFYATQAQTISGKSNPVKLQVGAPKSSPPVLAWISPNELRTGITTKKTILKIGITSAPKIKIKKADVFKNGHLIPNIVASKSPDAAQYARYIETEVELTTGPNEIKVVAENDKGEITTESRIITVTLPVESPFTYADLGINYLPTYHALIIGISDYKYSEPGLQDLNKPVKDAEKLYNVLISNYSFARENAKLLQNPTREQIIDQLEILARKVTDKDNVLIFFAGHGYHDKTTELGFWLPSDAKKDSRGSWIPNSQVKDYVRAIPAKHTLLISDACFSGSIFKTRRVDASSVLAKISETYRDKSRRAITSGNLSEVPDESYFIKFLIKTLEDNDQVFLTSQVLYSRILEPVMNNTATSPQQGVIQGADDEGGDFIFFKKME
jgi:hypothetical protein